MEIKVGANVIACGTLHRPAEYRLVGTNQTPQTRFSVRIGYGENASWLSCTCWRELAKQTMRLGISDTVLVAGTLSTREYNGKTYSDVNCEMVVMQPAAQSVAPAMPEPMQAAQETFGGFEATETDDELPF